MKLTPLHIEIVIWYVSSPSDFPRLDAPACSDYAKELFIEGILTTTNNRTYEITDKGRAWVEYICRTPFPIQQWVLPVLPQ